MAHVHTSAARNIAYSYGRPRNIKTYFQKASWGSPSAIDAPEVGTNGHPLSKGLYIARGGHFKLATATRGPAVLGLAAGGWTRTTSARSTTTVWKSAATPSMRIRCGSRHRDILGSAARRELQARRPCLRATRAGAATTRRWATTRRGDTASAESPRPTG